MKQQKKHEENMEEKRRFIRFQAPFCVQYSVDGETREFSGVIKDISMGGVRLTLDTASSILSDSAAKLSIMFPDETFKVAGKVIWSKEVGEMKEVGFCFSASTESGRERVHQHILKHFKEQLTRGWWQ